MTENAPGSSRNDDCLDWGEEKLLNRSDQCRDLATAQSALDSATTTAAATKDAAYATALTAYNAAYEDAQAAYDSAVADADDAYDSAMADAGARKRCQDPF